MSFFAVVPHVAGGGRPAAGASGDRVGRHRQPSNHKLSGPTMREKIKLVSTAGTGYFYTTTKNKRKNPDKLKLKKYDPVVRKHVEFVEEKME